MKQYHPAPPTDASAVFNVISIRILIPGDEAALDRFLAPRTASSIFLRSNLRRAGLVDRGEVFQGTYIAAVDDAGEIHAVACQYWNGNLVCQAPTSTAEFARATVPFLLRPVAGLHGPWDQAVAFRKELGLTAARARVDSNQVLFDLSLSDLILPPALACGEVRCRRSRDEDLDLLVDWRVQYGCEVMGNKDEPAVRQTLRTGIEQWHQDRVLWVLETEGRPVAMSGFNATLPDCVQVGGVWTPPALRSRGYARCVVAGSLCDARNAGANRAVLCADNPSAIRAYRALGFRPTGDYGIIQFVVPQPAPATAKGDC